MYFVVFKAKVLRGLLRPGELKITEFAKSKDEYEGSHDQIAHLHLHCLGSLNFQYDKHNMDGIFF